MCHMCTEACQCVCVLLCLYTPVSAVPCHAHTSYCQKFPTRPSPSVSCAQCMLPRDCLDLVSTIRQERDPGRGSCRCIFCPATACEVLPHLPAAAPSPATAPAACFDGPLVSATAALCSTTASAFSLPAFKAAVAAFLASSGASFGQVLVNTTRPQVQLSDCQTGTQNVQVQIEAAGPAVLVPALPSTPTQPTTAGTAQKGEPALQCLHVL